MEELVGKQVWLASIKDGMNKKKKKDIKDIKTGVKIPAPVDEGDDDDELSNSGGGNPLEGLGSVGSCSKASTNNTAGLISGKNKGQPTTEDRPEAYMPVLYLCFRAMKHDVIMALKKDRLSSLASNDDLCKNVPSRSQQKKMETKTKKRNAGDSIEELMKVKQARHELAKQRMTVMERAVELQEEGMQTIIASKER